MKRYQFACDARVTAVEVWDRFCHDLESDEAVSTEGHHTFSVSLLDEELEIYDGSGVFDREGNFLE